jgi:hypothetical protein
MSSLTRDEHAEQAALMRWAALQSRRYPALEMLFAIPNGGRRDAVTGARLKAEGVKAGVPDIFLPWPAGGWHGLFIELKAQGGRPTQAQRWWIERLQEAGYMAEVCYGWEEAAEVLAAYLDARIA